jgi:hypothetical protein
MILLSKIKLQMWTMQLQELPIVAHKELTSILHKRIEY